MAGMRARHERDDGLFAGVRRSMAYDQLPAAELPEQRLARAQDAGEAEDSAARRLRARCERSIGFATKSMSEPCAARGVAREVARERRRA